MPDFVIAHFHSPEAGEAEALSDRFASVHQDGVRKLRGFTSAQRFEICPDQLMPTIAQPWRNLTLYEFSLEQPEIHLPAIATLLADLRDEGLVAADGTERIYAYRMYSPWKFSANYTPGKPLSHVMLLLANVTPGRETEYHQWYDEQHSLEVSESPGYVGMKRGGLLPLPIEPVRFCPGDQLILGALQTDDLPATLAEFVARANGDSPSGVAWGDRSTAASQARTVHLFKSVNGPFLA